MKTKFRRLLSLLITLTMLVSLVPTSTLVAWTAPAQVTIDQVPGGMRSFFLTPAGNNMDTGFYYVRPANGGNNEVAYCVDAYASAPNANLYDFNDSSVDDINYMRGIQSIIQHGFPFNTNGLSPDDARYATQAAIHWLESFCLNNGAGRSWDHTFIDRVTAPGHEGALSFAKVLYNFGVNQTVIDPNVFLYDPSSWVYNNGTLLCTVQVDETDTDSWAVTRLPAGISLEGGPTFTGDVLLHLRMTDPVAYAADPNHHIELMSYTNLSTDNIHVFDISQSETDKTKQTMVAVSSSQVSDPASKDLPEGMGELQIFKVTRTMDRGDIPEANATFVLYPTTYASYDAAVAAGAPIGTVTTDATGFGTSTPLPLGDYVLHQTVAPRGMFPISDQVVTVKVYGPTDPPNSYFNEQGDGYVDVQKFTRLGSVRFPEVGAIFEVRNASNVVVDTLTTSVTGYDRSILLPHGNYTLVQTFAPVGTVIDTTVRSFEIGVDDSGNAAHADVVYFDIDNQITQGTVEIHKMTNLSVDVPEANAIFQVFPSVYATYTDAVNAGAICSSITTDATGYARTGLLPYGTYTVHQSSAPAGTIPVADRTVTVGAVNNDNQVLNLVNDTHWGDIEIQKYRAPASDPDNRTVEPGATFVIYPASYANYAAALAGDPKAADTCDVITTGADGIGRSTHPLPYGTYTCEQISSAATADTFLVQPWTVTIGATANQHYTYERTNEIYEQYLRIIKTDAETGLVIPLAGASFQILAADQVTILSDSTGKSEFTTDSTGQIDLNDMPLLVGTYYIKETKAPVGYTLATGLYPFTVRMSDHGSSIVTVSMGKDVRSEEFANERQTCSLSVEKQGETLITAAKVDAKDASGNLLTDSSGNPLSVYDFYYDQRPMNGAVFMVYAGENDIVDVNGVILYHANDFVGTMTTTAVTDSTGTRFIATMDELPLGVDGTAQYIVRETTAPLGQTLAANPLIFDFAYADQTISVISQGKAMQDSKQDVAIAVEKQKEVMTRNASAGNYETSIVAAQGIVFGLYSTNDILSPNGTVIVKKDSLVDLLITGADGKAASTKDLPFGAYYAKELKVTEGVVWDKTSVWPLTVSPDTDGETTLVRAALNDGQPIMNRCIQGILSIHKLAADTQLPMVGVVFEVYDKDGTLVDTLTTDSEGNAKTIVLPFGSYTLIETKTLTGYMLADKSSFNIFLTPKDGEMYSTSELTLVNQKMGKVEVYKVTADGTSTPMNGVVFGVYEMKSGKEVARITTDINGYGFVYVMSGDYYLKEISTWPGYAVSSDIIAVGGVSNGMIYTFREKNDFTTTTIEKTNTSGTALAGMKFTVTEVATGNLVSMYYDSSRMAYVALVSDKIKAPQDATIVTQGETGVGGTTLVLGLLGGQSYIFTEIAAPDGHNNDSDPVTITVGTSSGVLGTVRFVDSMIVVKTGEVSSPLFTVLATGCIALAVTVLAILIFKRKKQA